LQLLKFSSATRKGAQTPKSDYPDRSEPSVFTSCVIPHCSPMGAGMPDLRQALAVLHQMRPPSPESPTWGTDWGRGNISTAKRVPVVPDDPAPNEAALGSRKTVCPRDVLERAAILEFCEG
jgi:hypothetical protein